VSLAKFHYSPDVDLEKAAVSLGYDQSYFIFFPVRFTIDVIKGVKTRCWTLVVNEQATAAKWRQLVNAIRPHFMVFRNAQPHNGADS